MLVFAKHRSTGGKEPEFKALYISGKWFAKKGKLFSINIKDTDIDQVDVIYSLPDNDQHTMWTPKRHSRLGIRREISNKYWSPIRNGMTLHGTISTIDNTFAIDWKRQNITNLGELDSFLTKLHKSDKPVTFD